MISLYLIALLPITLGGVLWIINREIHWKEWIIGSVAALLLAVVFHITSLFSNEMVDKETWNGQVTKSTYYPKWVEEYQVAIYRTETRTGTRTGANGKSESYTYTVEVFSHYEDRYRTHHPYWEIHTNIREKQRVTQSDHNNIGKTFGGNLITKQVHKSGFYSGDRNIYYYTNETKSVVPFAVTKSWRNNLKGTVSIYNFPEVPEELDSKLYEWPITTNWKQSNRLLGVGNNIDILEWDKLNATLGPLKQCNLIMIGFGAKHDSSIAEWQRAKWIGGNKNDIVMCYGLNSSGDVAWVKSFGWSQTELVFANLDTILLNNPIDNSILPLIHDEVRLNYKRKEWSDFDYIKPKPPTWVLIIYPITLLIIQAVLYWVFSNNNNSNLPGESGFRNRGPYRRY